MNECKVVEDLWPLYLDKELSEETIEFVQAHLAVCAACRELEKDVRDMAIPWEPVEAPAGSAENFLRRWHMRRKRIMAIVFMIIALTGAGAWYYGQWSTSQASRQQEEQERLVFREQVAALNGVSPSPTQLLKRWGISNSVKGSTNDAGIVFVNYALRWDASSPVERIEADSSHWFDENLLINGESGAPLPLRESGWGSSTEGLTGNITTLPLSTPVNNVVLKTNTLYVFLKGAQESYLFDYNGGVQTVPLNEEFSYQGVKFSIDKLELDNRTFKVHYRQLTPAAEVGVFQLNFAFDDRLGNVWSSTPELAVTDPKVFSMAAPHSPAKHWSLRVTHVVQVIPGVASTIDLKGENKN